MISYTFSFFFVLLNNTPYPSPPLYQDRLPLVPVSNINPSLLDLIELFLVISSVPDCVARYLCFVSNLQVQTSV